VFKLFKIHIYTNGSRTYAKAIVNIIHEKFGKYSLFGGMPFTKLFIIIICVFHLISLLYLFLCSLFMLPFYSLILHLRLSFFLYLFLLTLLDEEHRILTRCDTFPERSVHKKKKNKPYLHKTLTSIYPHLDQFAVILDDREDIWSDSIEVCLTLFCCKLILLECCSNISVQF
jgi:hypothetical protein